MKYSIISMNNITGIDSIYTFNLKIKMSNPISHITYKPMRPISSTEHRFEPLFLPMLTRDTTKGVYSRG